MKTTQPSSDTETNVVRRRYDRGAGRYDVVTWPMERMAMDNIKAAGFAIEREDNLLSDVLKLVVAHS